MRPLRVVVVQDHPLLAAAIAQMLGEDSRLTVCGIVRTGAAAALVSGRENVAVVLMDSGLADMTWAAAAGLIRAASPATALVFHNVDDSEAALLDAIEAGAAAQVTRAATAELLTDTVRRAAQGEVLIPAALFAKAIARRRTAAKDMQEHDKLLAQFTPREVDILHLLAEGLDTTATALRLGVAPNTVHWHIGHLTEKLHVHSRLQAMLAAARLGLIDVRLDATQDWKAKGLAGSLLPVS